MYIPPRRYSPQSLRRGVIAMIGENSSPSNIWKFFRPVWDESGLPDRDLPIILAALIYLRWADFQEAELEAIRQSRGWRLLQQVHRLRIK